MKRFFDTLGPLLFPFFLTVLPILGLFIENRQRQIFDLEQKKKLWGQQASIMAQRLRVGFTYESQISQYAHELKLKFSRYTNFREEKLGLFLVKGFENVFPKSHRPPGTFLFGFGLRKDGKYEVLKTPGLAQENGRMFADILSKLGQSVPSPGEERLLNKRIAGLFGEDLSFKYLSGFFRGKAFPTQFRGEKVLMIWDCLETRKKTFGAYLMVFPFHRGGEDSSYRHALEKLGKESGVLCPILAPLAGERPDVRPVFPPGVGLLKSFVRKLPWKSRRLARDKAFPVGEAKFTPDYWLMRDFLSVDQPYEIWVTSPPQAPGKNPSEALFVLLLTLGITFWAFVLDHCLVKGRPLAVTMKWWVGLFLLFLALLSLSALYSFGAYYIETAKSRKIQDDIESLKEQISRVDLGVSVIHSHHDEVLKNLVFDRTWSRDFLQAPEHRRGELFERTVKHLLSRNPPIVLNTLLVFPLSPRGEPIQFVRPQAPPILGGTGANIFEPLIVGAAERFQPDLATKTMPVSGKPSTTAFSSLVRFSMDDIGYWNFMSMKQRIDLMESESDKCLTFYDFVASGGKFQGAFVFLCEIIQPYKEYLENNIEFQTFREPRRQLAFGQIIHGGLKRISPKNEKFWDSRRGKILASSMDLVAQTRADQFLEFGEFALFSHFAKGAKGYVIGGVVSLREFSLVAEEQYQDLFFVLFLLGVLMFLLGIWTVNHLLIPLSTVENGLLRLGDGDESVRLGIARNDELGDLAKAFDTMIAGIRERRELGRFVSRHLDVTVSQGVEQKGISSGAHIATVLVSDMREFTTLSERHPPEAVISMLNVHHQMMSEAVQAHGGFVELFIGDAIVAVFIEADPEKGIRSALAASQEMFRKHRSLQEERARSGAFTYEIGVGIDHGSIMAGTIGSGGRLEYTVLGKPRTRAEQLEALSKKGKRTKVIVSPDIPPRCPDLVFCKIEGEQAFELDHQGAGA